MERSTKHRSARLKVDNLISCLQLHVLFDIDYQYQRMNVSRMSTDFRIDRSGSYNTCCAEVLMRVLTKMKLSRNPVKTVSNNVLIPETITNLK